MRRPNPVLWLWYAFGGKLPARHRDWVVHDLTCRTWFARHVLRSLVLVSPVLALLYLVFGVALAGPGEVVLLALVLGMIVGVYYSLSYAPENADTRLTKYGFPRGHATNTRREREARSAAASVAERAARASARGSGVDA
ncbi:DUF5313 family protein [Allokutzneria sp. NRRL B-24872]|uniref:DUF5313 family protein n=1 Tax=Allokutzneria sp. NRRL B-24872 TaxID=1137961 RepID=UPI000A3D5B3A|nr:DUF5313 family protein [Allokutzneria sp. NRRL B-24872]